MSEPEISESPRRQLAQRLEALRRAGLSSLPRGEIRPRPTSTAARLASPPPAAAPLPSPEAALGTRLETPATAPVVPPASIIPVSRVASLFDDTVSTLPALSPEERTQRLHVLATEVAGCTRCPALVASRSRTVFSDGSDQARLMFVGEAPGADEDRTGVPFVGRAGQLLTDMITKGMGLRREDVYIANVIKCRPEGNRTPEPDECRNCFPYLEEQIELIRPDFLCLLGAVAARTLLDTSLAVGKLRGRWHRYRNIPTVVTWHPAYLLRSPDAKKDAWADLQLLMRAMGIKVPERPSRE